MRKLFVLMLISLFALSSQSLLAQGFDKKTITTTTKLVSVIGGNVELWSQKSDTEVTYTIRLKDHQYRRLNDFINLEFEDEKSITDFLNKVIYQYGEMKVGDSFDLGLVTKNVGVCKSIFGFKVLAITGDLNMFGYLEKKHAEKMLKYLQKE